MTTRVLVPYDGSPLSRRALEHACEVFRSASITAIHVINPVDAILGVDGYLARMDPFEGNTKLRWLIG